VTIVNSTLSSVVYATYIGGTGDEWIECSGVDGSGVATLHGASSSTDFPVTANAFQPSAAGGSAITSLWTSQEGIVLPLDPSQPPAQQLLYSTYLGGNSQDWCDESVALPSDEIVVIGTTASANFPTTPTSYRPTMAGGAVVNTNYVAGDAFLVRLDPNRSG